MVSFNSKIILAVLFACVAIGQSKDCTKICTLEYNPICATNGREYRLFGNPCTFEAFECETESVWTQLRSLAPCSDKVTADFSAGCETPCTREYTPICGTNGERFEMFSNLCLMKNAHCKDGKRWYETRHSDCNTVNLLSGDLKTNCEVPCTRELRPVCGFNGIHHKLFNNMCIMKNEHCKDGLNWFETRMMDCLARAEETQEIKCDKGCPRIYKPTCGFDGKSYQMFDNSCVMEVAACNQHVTFVDAPLSACETKITKANNCNKACPRIYKPTCGFDGKSYQMFDNSCVMEVAACDQHVTFVDAPLSACETKTVEKQNNDCYKPCPLTFAPVCGFDGKSYKHYASTCKMEIEACLQHITLVQVPLIDCETKTATKQNNDCNKACPLIYAPTCGFDGKSYQMFDNSCVMEVAACNQHVTFVDAPLSACETKTIEKECNKICPLIFAPVCGFDGKSYSKYANACMMESAGCNQHITFVEVPLSVCDDVPMTV